MKNIYFFIAALFLSGTAFGQANIRTAGELSGIILSDTTGFSIGYELSKTEAVFTYSVKGYEETRTFLLMKNQSIIEITDDFDPSEIDMSDVIDTIPVLEYVNSNFRITTALEGSASTVFSGGEFQPGIGLAYEHIYNKNQFTQNTFYNFFRISYEVKQNKFGSIDDTDSIKVDKEFSHSFGIVPGVNWVVGGRKENDNLIVALSAPIKYNINPTDDLKSKDFITDYVSSNNGVVQKAEKAWNGTQSDYFSVTPKAEVAWTPWSKKVKGVETGSRIGFISSLSNKVNFKESQYKWNFSVGPSLHPKWTTTQILATVQAEFLDFTDVTDSKDFEDILSVKFYVGIPLYFK